MITSSKEKPQHCSRQKEKWRSYLEANLDFDLTCDFSNLQGLNQMDFLQTLNEGHKKKYANYQQKHILTQESISKVLRHLLWLRWKSSFKFLVERVWSHCSKSWKRDTLPDLLECMKLAFEIICRSHMYTNSILSFHSKYN